MTGMAPQTAVVSLWLENGANPIGSGAFISPRLVLTARHVVDGIKQNTLRVGTIAGLSERAKCKQLHFPKDSDADIALIELFHSSDEQAFSGIGKGWELDRELVQLYAANPTTGNRDRVGDYPVSGFWHDRLVYFFPHRQRLGHSGGIAVHNGTIVGVISQRHETESQGTFVPLHLVWGWLSQYVDSPAPSAVFAPVVSTPDSMSECIDSHQWVANVINRGEQVDQIYDTVCGHDGLSRRWSVFSVKAEEQHLPRALAVNLYYAIAGRQPMTGDCIELPVRGCAQDKFRRALIAKISRTPSPPGLALAPGEAAAILNWVAQAENRLRVVYVPLAASEKNHRWCDVLSGAIETLRQLDEHAAHESAGEARGQLIVLFGCIPEADNKPWFKSLFGRTKQPELPIGCVQLDTLDLLKQAHIVEWRDGLLMSVSHELSKLGDTVCDELFASSDQQQTYKDVYRFIEKRLSPDPDQRATHAEIATHPET